MAQGIHDTLVGEDPIHHDQIADRFLEALTLLAHGSASNAQLTRSGPPGRPDGASRCSPSDETAPADRQTLWYTAIHQEPRSLLLLIRN